ncbi:hypothetical protein AVEN_178964-1 [Araneus ventricosus]|uniref:Uncharacterized protein n=1 Tax=Araneus ventricosus TaxID=182803 RepID=A0A4Y2UG26_ARAVE|nr:hypothetical protein AVEN_178964-1 [Araneus ventricosus]
MLVTNSKNKEFGYSEPKSRLFLSDSCFSQNHRGRRVPDSKYDSTEDPPCMRPVARQIISSGQTSSRWCGAEAWRGGASSGVIRTWFKIASTVPK